MQWVPRVKGLNPHMNGNSLSSFAQSGTRPIAIWLKHILLTFAMLVLFTSGESMRASDQAGTNAPSDYFPIDLSRFATTIFSNAPPGNVWSYLPRGRQTFQGVPFQIDGKFEVAGMDTLKGNNEFVPARVSGIPVGRKADKLVLLHGTGWTEKDAAPMAKLVLHYENGQERLLRIAYGVHVRNWYEDRSEKKKGVADPNSTVAWNGGDEDSERSVALRLYKTVFE